MKRMLSSEQVPSRNLASHTGAPISTLFHVSDIHIRKGDREYSRFDEYQAQIDKLVDY